MSWLKKKKAPAEEKPLTHESALESIYKVQHELKQRINTADNDMKEYENLAGEAYDLGDIQSAKEYANQAGGAEQEKNYCQRNLIKLKGLDRKLNSDASRKRTKMDLENVAKYLRELSEHKPSTIYKTEREFEKQRQAYTSKSEEETFVYQKFSETSDNKGLTESGQKFFDKIKAKNDTKKAVAMKLKDEKLISEA